MRIHKLFGIAGIITLVVVGILLSAFPQLYSAVPQQDTSTITENQLNESLAAPAGVVVSNNSINITIDAAVLIETGPMGANASMFSFLVYGQDNPVLNVKQGVSVKFMVVNIDTDATHNFAITTMAPPYPDMGPGMMFNSGEMFNTPYLDPHAGPGYSIYNGTFHAGHTGSYWYVCDEFGHASDGMYGRLNVY